MADVSVEVVQQKIQLARRDAEALKERIKRKKDELADTTRMSSHLPKLHVPDASERAVAYQCLCSARSRATEGGGPAPAVHEDQENTARPFGQDLRDALVDRPETSRIGIAGRQAHHLGRVHHQQSARHPLAVVLGHDMRVLT